VEILPIMFPALYRNSKTHWNKTIHGLIYNALKLFMEINQKLFDECTQNYKKERLKERELVNKRETVWSKLEEIASVNPCYSTVPHNESGGGGGSGVSSAGGVDDEMNESNLYQQLEGVSQEAMGPRNKEKPLLRRKSELPHDSYTLKALNDHKRADECLLTPPDVNKC